MTIGKKLKAALKDDFFAVEPVTNLTTGGIIKILREKNGFSQNQLAEITGLAQPTISGLENDRLLLGLSGQKFWPEHLRLILLYSFFLIGKMNQAA